MAHTLQLTNGAANTLRSIFSIPGLLTQPAEICRAGTVQEMLAEPVTSAKDPEQADPEWMKLSHADLELTDKQRDITRKVLQKAVEKGAIPVMKPVVELLRKFNLDE